MTALGLATVVYADEPAEKPAGVVELFTSQGCASCPPADALLEKLADEGAVVALAFHVNYWDYLGWRDTLGSEQNTERQNAYRLAPRFLANIRAARRLFADVGNWQMVIQLLDAELAACDDPRQKAALYLEKAQVLEDRLSREDDAGTAYQECLRLRPQDISLLIQLEGVFAGKNDFTSLVEVQRILSESLEDPTRLVLDL